MSARARLTRLLAFIGVGLFVIVGAAQGSTQQVRSPFSGTFINTCTGESIQFDGYLHYAVHNVQDAAGNYHIHAEANGQGVQGVGLTSGVHYSIAAAAQNGENFDPTNVPFTGTATQTFDLISAGSGDNATLTVLQRLTINANGEVTVSISDVTIACRG
jgi:hypothetical protein